MAKKSDNDKQKKKKQDAFEAMVFSLMQKSLKAAMDAALRELLQTFN